MSEIKKWITVAPSGNGAEGLTNLGDILGVPAANDVSDNAAKNTRPGRNERRGFVTAGLGTGRTGSSIGHPMSDDEMRDWADFVSEVPHYNPDAERQR